MGLYTVLSYWYMDNPKCKKCGIELKAGVNWYKAYENNHTYSCRECENKKKAQWCKNNPEKVRAANKRRWESIKSNPERLEREKERYRELWKNNINVREGSKNAYYKREYKISLEEVESIWKEQEGKCVLCGKELGKGTGKFAVDHNHITEEVRGILCTPCNLKVATVESWYYNNRERIDQYIKRTVEILE